MVLKIVATVFDALVMFGMGLVSVTIDDNRGMKLTLFLIVIMIINLFVIWG